MIQSNHQQLLQMLTTMHQPAPMPQSSQIPQPPVAPVAEARPQPPATHQLFQPSLVPFNNQMPPPPPVTSMASPLRQQAQPPPTIITSQITQTALKLKLEVLTAAMKDDHQHYELWHRGTMQKIIINPTTMTAINPSTQTIEPTITHRTKMIIYDVLEEALKPTAISTYLSTAQEM